MGNKCRGLISNLLKNIEKAFDNFSNTLLAVVSVKYSLEFIERENELDSKKKNDLLFNLFYPFKNSRHCSL